MESDVSAPRSAFHSLRARIVQRFAVRPAADALSRDFELIVARGQHVIVHPLAVTDVAESDVLAHGVTPACAGQPSHALPVAIDRFTSEQYDVSVFHREAGQPLLYTGCDSTRPALPRPRQ